MNPATIEEIVRQIDKMPSLSPTVGRIVQIANDPSSSPKDLATVITMDPVLTARVLKLVNSAYFGLSNQVTNILRAIILLGLTTIKNLALSTAVLSRFDPSKSGSGLDMNAFWRHSLAVAVTAKILARERGVDEREREEFFIAGLLHDIGKVVLDEHFPAELGQILRLRDASGCPLAVAEQRIIGVEHSEIGKWLGERWLLAPSLQECIHWHHRPALAAHSRETVATIHLANAMAHAMDLGDSGETFLAAPEKEAMQTLALSPDTLLKLEPVILSELDQAAAFLEVARH